MTRLLVWHRGQLSNQPLVDRRYPPPGREVSTRLPEFLPDGPRPFIPEPSFLPGSTEVVALQGQEAILPCTVQNLGAREVSWNRRGADHFLSIGTDVWVQDANLDIAHYSWPAGVSEWNLVIKEARLEDSGEYECKVISTEKLTWTVQLTVKEKMLHKPIISIVGKEFVESGQRLHLLCNTSEGNRIPDDLDWFKDGDKVEASRYPHILVTKYRSKDRLTLVSELTVPSGASTDSGTYICRSSSDLIASAEVSVLVADSSNVKRGTGTVYPRTAGGRIARNLADFGRRPDGPLLCLLVFSTTAYLNFFLT